MLLASSFTRVARFRILLFAWVTGKGDFRLVALKSGISAAQNMLIDIVEVSAYSTVERIPICFCLMPCRSSKSRACSFNQIHHCHSLQLVIKRLDSMQGVAAAGH